ncbi:hypothetical protein Leryth_018886 [Lithospermum erythrorhizon]|nr:hypothetical protein Leryth_018886 [Lithospermum erythrorhizon]
MGGPLSAWPWERLGSFKYMLYAPLVSKIVYSRYYGESMVNIWCHIFIISMLRCLIYQGWSTFSNMLFLNRNKQIFSKGLDFEQIDKEWDWDNFIILQAITSSVACYLYPYLGSLPLWNGNGVIAITSLHVAVSEPLYYWAHKAFHGIYLFTHYHSLHHSSAVPQPFTAGHATFLEHLVFTAIIGIPILGCCLLGYGSISIIYAYVLAFDMLRCLGHCNVEIVPYQMFEILPILKYIIYTPTYHSLHHKDMGTNFCLFMPLFDALGNTLNKNSWEMYKKSCTESVKNGRIPDFVFLAHVVDLTSALHVPFMFRSYSSIPYSTRIFLLPLWPICFFSMLGMWAKSKAFLVSFYNLRGRLHQTWAVPRFGFQYFLPFCAKGINEKIEEAILRADKLGVKVISLAALNKNEALNGGGTLFVNKHPTLKVRVVHGNTLTAAVTLNEIPKDVTEVFLTGSTSKLGRAIALYLCHRNVRVLMLTTSTERFKTIQKAHI